MNSCCYLARNGRYAQESFDSKLFSKKMANTHNSKGDGKVVFHDRFLVVGHLDCDRVADWDFSATNAWLKYSATVACSGPLKPEQGQAHHGSTKAGFDRL
jgi:hypothetical protein